MGICYIVGAGECSELEIKKNDGDLIIAADGGYKYLEAAGISPDILIGDFDSLTVVPETNDIIRLNPVKDITDMHAAADIGIEKGYSHFVFYGALGGRLDHTLANIQLIAMLSRDKITAEIRDKKTVINAITDGTISFDASCKGYVSVFSHTDKCKNVSISGLKYTLENSELTNVFSLGVSNEFIGEKSVISVEKGTLIIVSCS